MYVTFLLVGCNERVPAKVRIYRTESSESEYQKKRETSLESH